MNADRGTGSTVVRLRYFVPNKASQGNRNRLFHAFTEDGRSPCAALMRDELRTTSKDRLDSRAFRHTWNSKLSTRVGTALGDAETVLNVGAGAGSYEPLQRHVTAVEPSASMRAQRPAHLSRAIDATAESLPFETGSFDASMATFSVHQWSDLESGLAEMRRVTRGPVLILTCEPAALRDTWLYEYAPEMIDVEARRYPSMERIRSGLGSRVTVIPVPIPLSCTDGFSEAYYGRPERLLDSGARRANSAWSFVDSEVEARFAANLQADLKAGLWDQKHGRLRKLPLFEGSLRLLVGQAADGS